jgi:hypothetical protein
VEDQERRTTRNWRPKKERRRQTQKRDLPDEQKRGGLTERIQPMNEAEVAAEEAEEKEWRLPDEQKRGGLTERIQPMNEAEVVAEEAEEKEWREVEQQVKAMQAPRRMVRVRPACGVVA